MALQNIDTSNSFISAEALKYVAVSYTHLPHAVIHLYNSTSVAQREQVFKKSKEEVRQLAVDGAELLKTLAAETDGNFTFEYSPESFPGTEVDYACLLYTSRCV